MSQPKNDLNLRICQEIIFVTDFFPENCAVFFRANTRDGVLPDRVNPLLRKLPPNGRQGETSGESRRSPDVEQELHARMFSQEKVRLLTTVLPPNSRSTMEISKATKSKFLSSRLIALFSSKHKRK